jgi:hypothetical protein
MDNQYQFNEFVIPEYMQGGLQMYINDGIPPGDFLTAVICNDLSAAIGRADNVNIRNMPAYVNFFYNYAPSNCWGSKKMFKSWVKTGGLNGLRKKAQNA